MASSDGRAVQGTIAGTVVGAVAFSINSPHPSSFGSAIPSANADAVAAHWPSVQHPVRWADVDNDPGPGPYRFAK